MKIFIRLSWKYFIWDKQKRVLSIVDISQT